MVMSIHLAEMIVMEHKHRPIPAIVHTLGRLITGFDETDAAAILKFPCSRSGSRFRNRDRRGDT